MLNKVTVIILAGGNSTRTGFPMPKQFYILDNGKSLIDLVLKSYVDIKQIDEIIFVYNKDYKSLSKKICGQYSNKIHFVKGGSTRQQSVYNALKEVKTKYVLIHDLARPLVWRDAVVACIEKLKKDNNDIVHTVFPVSATMFLLLEEKQVRPINRDKILFPQCPIGFFTENIKKYYEYVKKRGLEFHDDISVALYANSELKVKFVQGHQSGFKITYNEDMKFLEVYIGN